jgi:hypothetical protein
LLNSILSDLDIPKADSTTPLNQFNGYTKQIYASNLEIKTSSLLPSPDDRFPTVIVQNLDGSTVLHNVHNLALSDYSNLAIDCSSAYISDGLGFYANIQTNDAYCITSSGMSVSLISDEGNFETDNVTSLSIAPSDGVVLQVRLPTVSADHVVFYGFYLQRYSEPTVAVYGQDLVVAGLTNFTVAISDNYQAIANLTLGMYCQVASDVQITSYDIFSTLPTALYWFIFLGPVIISIVLLWATSKKRDLVPN